jgi:hypothetical protein
VEDGQKSRRDRIQIYVSSGHRVALSIEVKKGGKYEAAEDGSVPYAVTLNMMSREDLILEDGETNL